MGMADMASCGSHKNNDPEPTVSCSGAAIGASCNTATAGVETNLPGTCQLPITYSADAGADGGASHPPPLVCVAQPEQGSVLSHGVLGFVAPWLIAMLFPLLLRKRRKGA